MARTLVLDTITDPDNSGAANITLSSDTTTTLPKVDINSGAIDNTTLGAATPSSVAATTLSASGNTTIGGTATVGGTLGVTGASTLATVDINGGTIDGATIGASSAAAGTFTTGTFTTVNTGQGANELYDMNQNVLTSSNVSFGTINGMNFHAKDYYNTAVGIGAFANWSSGDGNTCVGYYAGVLINSGGYNTVVGYDALKACTTTASNTAVGAEALKAVAAPNGNWNTALGRSAGESITTGANNVCIGNTSGGSSSPSGEITTGNYQLCLGNNTITNAFIKVDWTVTSDERDKADIVSMAHGLDVIENINPINFVWDTRTDHWAIPDTADEDGNKNITKHDSDGSKKQSENLRTGFSAQNVKDALDAVGWEGNAVVNSEDPENLKITHSNIIPFLVNAIKELSAKVKTLESA